MKIKIISFSNPDCNNVIIKWFPEKRKKFISWTVEIVDNKIIIYCAYKVWLANSITKPGLG